MRSLKLCPLSVIIGTIWLLSVTLVHAVEFTATIVRVVPQRGFVPQVGRPVPALVTFSAKYTGKIYVKGDKERTEVEITSEDEKFTPYTWSPPARSIIAITRPDKNLEWVLNPLKKKKTYFKIELGERPRTNQIVQVPGVGVFVEKAKMKKIGTETVNGYECDKFEYEMRPIEKPHRFKRLWISKNLGIPIKFVSVFGGRTRSIELKDIKFEKLDDSLFELPSGYRKDPSYFWGAEENLIKATKRGDLPEVKRLLAKGANVNAKDSVGKTALMWASLDGHLEIVQALLAKGAEVNAKSKVGRTALIFAFDAKRSHREVVEALLAKGADVNAKDKDGKTALMKAKRQDIRELLIKAGAK